MMKKGMLTRIAAILLAVSSVPLLYLISRYSYNLFHSLADGLSIVIAACAFVVVWNSRRNVDNHYFTYLGISLLFFAFLDLMHMLGNKNMGVFPGYGNLGPTFYIAGRYVLSLSLVIAPFFINRRLNTFLMFVFYSAATLLIILSVFYWKVFPACIIEGVALTPFKIVSDYVICVILLGAAGLLFVNRQSFDPRVLKVLIFSIILSIATGLMFTLYTDPFGVANMAGHLFQIASFYLIYVAVIETSIAKPQEILFRKLKQHEEKLIDNVLQLDRANAELQQEIAERKQAEKALHESEQRWAITLASIGDAVIATDVEGRITFMNPVAETVTGWRLDQAVSRPVGEVFSVIGEETRCPVAKVLREGPVVGLANHTILVRKDGTEVPIDDSGAPIRDAVGNIVGVVLAFRDITERKAAEEVLRRTLVEAEERLRLLQSVMEQVPTGITIADAPDIQIRMVSRYGEEILGGPHHGMTAGQVAHRWRVLAADGTTPLSEDELPLVRAIRYGDIVSHAELVQETEQGERLSLLCNASPIRDSAGKITGGIVAWLDITRRKQVEEALRHAHDELEVKIQQRTEELRAAYERLKEETREREQAESQMRHAQKMEALGILAGGIAHDFNNILAAIIGFSELARDRTVEGARERRYLERVLQAGLRGRELVRHMLTFSRQTEQEKKPLQLSSIIKETVKLLRASLPSTLGINFSVKSESGVILGDPVQIQQVVMNLVTNGAYAMREKGGILDMELSDFTNSDIQGMEPGLYMKLVVRDTGSGIATDVIDKVFDPFFTTKPPGEGTGLGLSVVMGIVKQAHGYITVESTVGKGSIFTVYFPKIEEERGVELTGCEDMPLGHEKVLFVDDEEALVEMGADILGELGYEVIGKTSSREALALFRLDPTGFDIVITDMTMPGMTGIQLASELLAIRPDTPIILTTGFSHMVTEESARAVGAKGFVVKPVTKGEIAKTVRRVLDG